MYLNILGTNPEGVEKNQERDRWSSVEYAMPQRRKLEFLALWGSGWAWKAAGVLSEQGSSSEGNASFYE